MGSKGSPGEASIFRAKDGRWHGWITVGTEPNGKPDRRHRTAQDPRRGRREDPRARGAARDRQRSPRSTPTPSQAWFDHWLTNIAARRVRPRTLESYESMIRMHITPYLGGQRLDRLQPEHLEQLYNALLEQGLSPTTVLRVHRIISRALKVAMQRQRIHRNVATLVDPPAQRRSEVATALDPRRGHRRAARGARRCATRPAGPSPSPSGYGSPKRSLCSGKTSTCSTARWPCGAPCTGSRARAWSTRRRRPRAACARSRCPSRWSARCTSTRRARPASGCSPPTSGTTTTWSSPSPTAGPSTRRPTTTPGAVCCSRAGVRHVRLHDGRHTAATLLLSEGVHPRVVMELLGHSQMRTTMDIYSHVMPALAREAADRMGAVLLGGNAPDGSLRTPAIEGGLQPLATKDATSATMVILHRFCPFRNGWS